MIAYNHYIKFIPELENDQEYEDVHTDIITVRQSSHQNIDKKLSFKHKFSVNQGRELSYLTDREFSRAQKNQTWSFVIQDVVTFFWKSGTMTINYIPQKLFTIKLLKYWLLQTLLPLYFTIEEVYDFLHAGSVEVNGKIILFIAESYGGKSTITDYFMKQGHTLVSDDKVATYKKNGIFYAVPSHPHHRPYRGLEDLGYTVKNIISFPKPIHAIYRLEKDNEKSSVNIERIRGIEKFKALRMSSDFNLFYQKHLRFEYLMSLGEVVPIYNIKIPWNINRLNDVYMAVVKHSKSLSGHKK